MPAVHPPASGARSRRGSLRSGFLGTTIALLAVGTFALSTESTAVAAALGDRGAPGQGDPYFPLSGNGGYTTRHYDLDLAYDPAGRELDGTATITARATQRLTRFDLDLSGLTVRGIRVDGRAARWTRDGQELVITPRTALRRGQVFRVEVRYGGVPANITDPDGSADGWISTDDGAFVAGEPQGAMSWFPADNAPLDKASYTFEITVPTGYTAVANGVLTSQRSNGGKGSKAGKAGTTTFRWNEDRPMASYLATATVGKFDVQRYTTASGIPVYNAVDPREAAGAAPALARIPAILDWESKLFGPYPFAAAGAIVDHAPDVGYALETQTRPLYDRAPDVGTVVHETAHQWFGDSVSLTSWQDIWLNEGFATYAEWLWDEQHGGPTAQARFDGYYARAATSSLWAFPTADPGKGENIFASPVYTRGAMALQKLRTAIGDPDFFAILKSWARIHRYGNGTTAQFVALSEKISGKDLGALFHTWIYTAGKPAQP